MSNSRRKRSRRSNHASNIVSSVALIVIAVLLLIFVYFYISNNSFTDVLSIFSKDSDVKESESVAEGEEDSDSLNTAAGLVECSDGSLVYVLTEAEAAEHEPEQILDKDGQHILADSWYEDGDALYYFGDDGYAVKDYSEDAMQYTFDKEYKLSSIKYNDAYISESEDVSSDYPSAVQTKTLWAFLDTEKSLGDLCAIKYKKTTESFSHSLGGDTLPQYTSRFAMSIADGYIYYAAFCDSSDKLTESIANKLFRMKPGTDYRELGAEDIRGYKVYESPDGDVSVYYDDGHKVRKAVDFEKDDSVMVFSEDASYYVDYSSGAPILMLEGGYPVTLVSSSFKAGNFTYSLNADGEITAVASKTKVVTGGYTYTVENGASFGSKKARVVRTSGDKTEVISAEFDGSCGNLHYDFASSKIIAEYTDKEGQAGLLAISLDGDVDVIYDASKLGSTCILYSIQDGYAIVKTADNEEPFKKAKLAASYPLAVGIDPVDITDEEGQETSESDISGSTDGSNGESSVNGNTGASAANAASSETAAAPSVSSKSSGASAETSAANTSGKSNNDPSIINDNQVEKKGPGAS